MDAERRLVANQGWDAMTIKVTDPDGKEHEFADGTSDAAINAEMQRRWATRGAPAAPAPTPLTGPGKMPPGTVPSGLSARPTFDVQMPPLSADAQRYERMRDFGGITGNRALEAAGKSGLESDPTFEARKKHAVGIGELNKERSAQRDQGANILRSFAQLRHAFDEAPDDVIAGSIGPYNLSKYSQYTPLVSGMTYPQAMVAYPWLNRVPGYGTGSPAAAADNLNMQKLLGHDVHSLVTAFMTGAKGLNLSDARQQAFEAAMGDFMHAADRKGATKILEHTKGIIANDFGITHDEADALIEQERARIKEKKSSANGPGRFSPPEGALPRPATPEEARKLPKGTRFFDPSGNVREVP